IYKRKTYKWTIESNIFSSEELTVTLSCNYSVTANNLQWYRQDPGSAPRFLLLITDTKEPSVVEAKPPNPRLTAVLNRERNQFHVNISSAAVTDSAVYYCALQPTVTGNIKTLHKNLQKKNTPQPPPERVTHLILTMEEHMPSSFCSLHNESLADNIWLFSLLIMSFILSKPLSTCVGYKLFKRTILNFSPLLDINSLFSTRG
uniref:Ig-like domain-containing protein n=1 Tax=Oryzias latipes TaxID=8090 RepID=A0A3B3HXY0_ORYLA